MMRQWLVRPGARTTASRYCAAAIRRVAPPPPSPPPRTWQSRWFANTSNDADTTMLPPELAAIDTPTPPTSLTVDMAEGIGDMTQFYIRYGLSKRRLEMLHQASSVPLTIKWQKMMEIFLTTQIHVIAGLGYTPDEHGLTLYAQHLAACVQAADEDLQLEFSAVRRETWRELVATAFGLDMDDIPNLTMVEARNLMHQVSSKMIEPDVLLEVQTKTAKIKDDDEQMEIAKKHQILQDIIVNSVYLGGDPPLVQQAGFAAAPATTTDQKEQDLAQAYATLQCAMADHEGDPLIAQYASTAMAKLWEAAGLDLRALQNMAGSIAPGAPPSTTPPGTAA